MPPPARSPTPSRAATITYATIESITAVKGISTALAVQGATDYTVTPGAATDQGTILADTFPIAYQGYGAGTNLKLNGTGKLTINGTAANDAFSVAAASGNVSFTGRATIQRTGTSTSLILNGLAGDDTFTVNGHHALHGDQPQRRRPVGFGQRHAQWRRGQRGGAYHRRSDPADRHGAPAWRTVTLTGVEVLNLTNGGGAITVNGTAGPNAFTVTPTGADTASISVAGVNQVVNTTNTGTLRSTRATPRTATRLRSTGRPRATRSTWSAASPRPR